MEFVKSFWQSDRDTIRVGVPIAKIDKANRLVSGFATLDNIDTADDVVVAEASAGAFERFRGNIREMHQPIAAGRLVDFREDSYYDSRTQKFYKGIYVTAYVSKGAQDTWEKVLDGTLSGFSIGGSIVESESEFVKDAGKTIRYITKYDLIELSLVDNPANQLANVDSIVKFENNMVKGILGNTQILNIFWCPSDEVAKSSASEFEDCISCGSHMEVIGWFEKGEDEVTKVAGAVSNFLRQKEGTNVESGEGGGEMTDEITKSVEEEVPAEEVVEEAAVETEVVADAEEEAAVEEVAPEADFEKMFDDLKGAVNDSIAKNAEAVAKGIEAVEAKVADITKSFDEKHAEFEKSLAELREGINSVRTEREGVEKRLDALEKASAIKKSGDVEAAPEKKLQKGLWSGAFFDGE